MNSYITSISTATPPYCTSQDDIALFMANFLQADEYNIRKIRAIYKASGIEQRFAVVPDFQKDTDNRSLFASNGALPNTARRMECFEKEAIKLAYSAAEGCLKAAPNAADTDSITHLITVSCTGLFAPGPDIVLVEMLGLKTSIQRIAINFMGCYAAFNAIKTAESICLANPEARVLIVCVELCSLHLQQSTEEDHLLSAALFGDGAAALLMEAKKPEDRISLNIAKHYCDLFFDGKSEMAWHIGDFGFEMKLSSYIPGLVRQGIKMLTHNLLKNYELTVNDIEYFAIHPGGRRILEAIECELEISKNDNRFSYEVLRDYGNMSSVTVLFVLKKIFDQAVISDLDKHILSFAFGPGLTLESMLFKIT